MRFPLGVVLGVFRFTALAALLLAGTLSVLVAGLMPFRFKGVAATLWVAAALARLACYIFGVRLRCVDPSRLRRHRGLIFPNHSSLLDTLVIFAITPVRFLSAAEVVRYPFLGWIARSVGTVFVARTNRQSRRQARHEIIAALRAAPHLPIVLFPEGRLGPGDRLYPFRHGAFALAAENQVAYLPCALRYTPLAVARWYGAAGEEIWTAAWRLASYPGRVLAEVMPLEPVLPSPGDEPETLAATAQGAIAAALGIDPAPLTPPESEPPIPGGAVARTLAQPEADAP
jgi:1-acyl-sn-glycerol-3-phosphate acyltransferase